MGLDLYAGDKHDRAGDGSWLIVSWLGEVAPRQKPAGMSDYEWGDILSGSINYDAEAVRRTDEAVPRDWLKAMARGFLKDEDLGRFYQSRDFLTQAARDGVAITGSY